MSNYIRISAGKPTDTDRVMEVLNGIGSDHFKLCQELQDYDTQAILLDMDGVLADVTFSQHTVQKAWFCFCFAFGFWSLHLLSDM